jgi:hypothetical protein
MKKSYWNESRILGKCKLTKLLLELERMQNKQENSINLARALLTEQEDSKYTSLSDAVDSLQRPTAHD